MKRRFLTIFVALALPFLILPTFFACDKSDEDDKVESDTPLPAVDYSLNNIFEVEYVKDEVSYSWSPKGVEPSYGVIFYVGTVISAPHYSYMAEFLASRGYLVVMPIAKMDMTYMFYTETEPAFEKFPKVKFFLAGHSQGGGAALRRASENLDKTQGAIFWAPLTYGEDTLFGTSLPALYIEGDRDGILSKSMKDEAKETMPQNYEYHLIQGGNHMAFASGEDMAKMGGTLNDGSLEGITDAEFKDFTLSCTLSFINTIVRAQAN